MYETDSHYGIEDWSSATVTNVTLEIQKNMNEVRQKMTKHEDKMVSHWSLFPSIFSMIGPKTHGRRKVIGPLTP
jgi:hypothetical protein